MSDKITREGLMKLWTLVEIGGGQKPITMTSLTSQILDAIGERYNRGIAPEVILLSLDAVRRIIHEKDVGQWEGMRKTDMYSIVMAKTDGMQLFGIPVRVEEVGVDFLVLP